MIGKTLAIDNTKFIFATNFAGDPTKDRYNDARPKANIIIPDPEQAKDLIKAGVRVRETRPRPDDDPDDFQPEYFITALLKYRGKNGLPVKYPPKVFLVSGDSEPVLLDEETVKQIDTMRVHNVNVILNSYEYDAGKLSLYIRTMYVEQDLYDDPYAHRWFTGIHGRRYEDDDDRCADPFHAVCLRSQRACGGI